MNKPKTAIVVLVGVLVLVLQTIPVNAQSSVRDVTGGSRSSDYQPQTDNPQSDVSTGLQQTDASLQPLPNQKNFSQQNLSGVADLRVAGSNGDPNPNTTSTTPAPRPRINLLPHFLIGIAVVAGIFVVARSRDDNSSTAGRKTAAKEPKPEPLRVQKATSKKASKKKPAQKRKKRK